MGDLALQALQRGIGGSILMLFIQVANSMVYLPYVAVDQSPSHAHLLFRLGPSGK